MAEAHGGVKREGLYREAILEHARRPSHGGRLAAPHLTGSASNTLCGDELELTLEFDGGSIRAVGCLVRGCTIVQAAASMMSEAVSGLSLEQARAVGSQFREAMERSAGAMEPGAAAGGAGTIGGAEGEALPPGLEPLEPLTAVRRHRSRIRCALLPWDALENGESGPTSE